MKDIYDLRKTIYQCKRCDGPIEVESDEFYSFGGPDDPAFWCSNCEDLPWADIVGEPAQHLPGSLRLAKGFDLKIVPILSPIRPGDPAKYSLLFRPYSKRSFLHQYLAWVRASSSETFCSWAYDISFSAAFDRSRQEYVEDLEYTISDRCNERLCQVLRSEGLKPQEPYCTVLKLLCDVRGQFGLCETGDEAMILQHYLLITGVEQFPMLIPQVSLLEGKRRADFVAFVPVSRYQYHKVAVLIDRRGKDSTQKRTEETDYLGAGYIVHRIMIDPNVGKSYFKKARELVLWMRALSVKRSA
jgi:hypothetical protein